MAGAVCPQRCCSRAACCCHTASCSAEKPSPAWVCARCAWGQCGVVAVRVERVGRGALAAVAEHERHAPALPALFQSGLSAIVHAACRVMSTSSTRRRWRWYWMACAAARAVRSGWQRRTSASRPDRLRDSAQMGTFMGMFMMNRFEQEGWALRASGASAPGRGRCHWPRRPG